VSPLLVVLASVGILHAQGGASNAEQFAPSAHRLPGNAAGSLTLPETFRPGILSGRFSSTLGLSESPKFAGAYRLDHGVLAGHSADLPSLFQEPSGSSRDLGFGVDGTSQLALKRLASPGRGGPDLRLNAAAGSFRLSHRDLRLPSWELPGAKALAPGEGFGQGSPSATYTNSGFAHGMFNVSATTMYGGRPVTGSLGAGTTTVGSVPGGQKRSAPSVALKLSF